jgi:hypothetical protein
MIMSLAPNDGASAAALLRPTIILAENTKPHLWIRTRRLGGQLQARVGQMQLTLY